MEMAIGAHLWFCREGDAFATGIDPDGGALGPGVVSAIAKPDADDAAWLPIDVVESWEDSIKTNEKEVRTPVLGILVRKRMITTSQDMDMKFTSGQVSPLSMELFYRSSAKLDDASTQFVPLSAAPRQGFLKGQRYSDGDVLIMAFDFWVRLMVTGGMKGGDGVIVLPEFDAALLYSPHNTVGL